MDCNKIARILYGEFGCGEFVTRDISAPAMQQLARVIGIADPDPGADLAARRRRRLKVGRALCAMAGPEYKLESGQKVTLAVPPPPDDGADGVFRFTLIAEMETDEPAVQVTVPEAGTYHVVIVQSGDGYAAICPALRGCVSQGLSEQEAMVNIKEAITGWLKLEERSIRERTQATIDEYRDGGYPAKLRTVTVSRGELDATVC